MTARDDLWRGSFGNAYIERQKEPHRAAFWKRFYANYPVASVLEIGCGVGYNLRHAVAERVYGMDVNAKALDEAAKLPHVVTAEQSLFDRGFADASFELVFTCGVLIHIPRVSLDEAIGEMIRLSSRYVMAMEYENAFEEAVPYHGQEAALWKRPYRRIMSERLGRHEDGGYLDARSGFDRVVWSLWQKK